MFYAQGARDRSLLPHDPFKAIVTPRPIGWVATMSRDGAVNLAPYSFFNAFGSDPPFVGFSSEGFKDSAAFATETREFTFNLATYALRDRMNMTSAPLARGASEFVHAGLTPAPSRLVGPPRVAESPASLECVVTDIVELRRRDGAPSDRHLVIGEVVAVHIDDRFIRDGRFDTAAAQPLARCGYQDYAVVTELFSLTRPPGAGND